MNTQWTKTGMKLWTARVTDKYVTLIAVALVALSFCSVALADPNDLLKNLEARVRQRVTVEDLLAYAHLNNPAIQTARERFRAAGEIYRIETGYPDPQVMVTYYPEPIETRLGPQDWNATLSQAIPLPGKRLEAGKMAQAKATLADLALDKVAREVTVAVRESVNELFYTQEATAIVKRQIELFNNLISTTESAYAQDRVALVAVINAHSHADALQKDLLILGDMAHTETARLNSLLGRPPDGDFGVIEAPLLQSPAISLEEMYRFAEVNQEEIQMAETRIEQREAELSLARYSNLPEFKVGLFYAAIGNPDISIPPAGAGEDALGVQLSISLPIWGKKNNGRIEKARAEMAAAVSDKVSRIDDIRARIRSLYYRLEKSRGIIDLYENKLLPQARTAVDATENWFLAKQPNFSDFVEAQSLWYQFQLVLARTRADYGKDLARLERLVQTGDRTDRKEAMDEGRGTRDEKATMFHISLLSRPPS